MFGPGEKVPETELRSHFRSVGRQVVVYRGARFVLPGNVDLGDRCQIDEGAFVGAGDTVIGDYAHLAYGCVLLGGGRTEVGNYVGISSGVKIVSGTENFIEGLNTSAIPVRNRNASRSFCSLEEHCLIFANAVILPGVTVGRGAVVAAGSIVHRPLKSWGIYGGNPLVQIGIRDEARVLKNVNVFQNEQGSDD